MATPQNKLSQFWQELKRRNVVRVVTVYAGTAFVILELVDIIDEPLKLPSWLLSVAIVLLSIGFIIAVILSWIYDIHPEGGVVKTEPAEKVKAEDVPKSSNGWKIASYISFGVIVGLIILNIIPRKGEREILDKSIAVLPFENMSNEGDFNYLGDAISDEIIMQLYKIHEFEVRSRTSIMRYKNSLKGSKEIGEELNVNYLVEGSAQRHLDHVRIRVQLIQASTDDHIWGEVYEGQWKDIYNIQIDVAKKVASELKTALSLEEEKRIEKKPTGNLEAYNLYLQGRYFQNQVGKEELDKSVQCFLKAVELDARFALAYVGMAETYYKYATMGYTSRQEVVFKAKESAIKALELDNELGEAHAVLAYTKVIYDWDWGGAEEGFKRALTLNPNHAAAHLRYGRLLTFLRRFDEAQEEYKRAHELDPLDINYWINIGRGYYWANDFDKAIDEYNRILEHSPASEYTRAQLALALSQKGFHNEAIMEISKVNDPTEWYWFYRGYIYGNAGDNQKAQDVLDYYSELSRIEFVWPTNFAFIHASMGEIDKALQWLEITYEEHEAWLATIQVESMYDNLRPDPRFQELVDRMKFPDY